MRQLPAYTHKGSTSIIWKHYGTPHRRYNSACNAESQLLLALYPGFDSPVSPFPAHTPRSHIKNVIDEDTVTVSPSERKFLTAIYRQMPEETSITPITVLPSRDALSKVILQQDIIRRRTGPLVHQTEDAANRWNLVTIPPGIVVIGSGLYVGITHFRERRKRRDQRRSA